MTTMESSELSERSTIVDFPCLEEPLRVTLYCNGHYLRCLNRNGVLAGRRQRGIKDEFRFQETEDEDDKSVMLINEKFGSILSVVENSMGERRALCIPGKTNQQDGIHLSDSMMEESDTEVIEESKGHTYDNKAGSGYSDDGNVSSDDEIGHLYYESEELNVPLEAQKWSLVKITDGYLCLQNMATGDRLGVSVSGKLILEPKNNVGAISMWKIEPVTGELCYLSNNCFDRRIRCDMTGRLSLSENWKGWEVFRFLEAGDGFVKISNYAHSQWVLSCHSTGKIQMRKHSESQDNFYGWCSEWAVELSPVREGVIFRSKSYGRFLCIESKEQSIGLASYHPFDEASDFYDPESAMDEGAAIDDHATFPQYTTDQKIDEGVITYDEHVVEKVTTQNPSEDDQAAYLREALARKTSLDKRNQRGWTFRKQKRSNKRIEAHHIVIKDIHVTDTITWDIKAAHLQHYYLSSKAEYTDEETGKSKTLARSIGPFPRVTRNLRRTDKFHMIRRVNVDNGDVMPVVQLYHSEREEFVACLVDGTISLTKDEKAPETEWIMEQSSFGGNSLQSLVHKRYLAHMKVDIPHEHQENGDCDIPREEEDSIGGDEGHAGPFRFFRRKTKDGEPRSYSELIGSETLGPQGSWYPIPSIPRAVNSGKVARFAIGTSLVLGSSLALPVALAGAGTLFHLSGHSAAAYHVVVAGLSSLDAFSSIGAVGATAYFVFRPKNISKEAKTERDVSEEVRARFKRPFCDWRNWDYK